MLSIGPKILDGVGFYKAKINEKYPLLTAGRSKDVKK